MWRCSEPWVQSGRKWETLPVLPSLCPPGTLLLQHLQNRASSTARQMFRKEYRKQQDNTSYQDSSSVTLTVRSFLDKVFRQGWGPGGAWTQEAVVGLPSISLARPRFPRFPSPHTRVRPGHVTGLTGGAESGSGAGAVCFLCFKVSAGQEAPLSLTHVVACPLEVITWHGAAAGPQYLHSCPVSSSSGSPILGTSPSCRSPMLDACLAVVNMTWVSDHPVGGSLPFFSTFPHLFCLKRPIIGHRSSSLIWAWNQPSQTQEVKML